MCHGAVKYTQDLLLPHQHRDLAIFSRAVFFVLYAHIVVAVSTGVHVVATLYAQKAEQIVNVSFGTYVKRT